MKKQRTCGIYKITSPSKKIYIGQSIDIISRWGYYKCLSCKSQTRLYRSLLKYGVKKHKFEILTECEEGYLNELEKYYVDLYQTFNSHYGLNLKDGGGQNTRHSEETKIKIRNSNKGRVASDESKLKMRLARIGKKASTETKLKMSLARKGVNNVNYGIKLSQEKIDKMRSYNIGRKISEETRKKMSASQRLRTASEETKNKMRLAKTGIKFSEESKMKMRLAKLGKKRSPHSEETKIKISTSNIGKTKNRPWTENRRMAQSNKLIKSISDSLMDGIIELKGQLKYDENATPTI